MVLADTVLRDAVTGKFYIQGTYSVILAPEFPWTHPSIVLYWAITNGHGKTPIKFRLIDVDEEDPPVFETEAVMEFADPLIILKGVFAAQRLVFQKPGEYRLQLFGAGVHLGERRLPILPPPGLPETPDKF
jgi:hypothetical protein